MLNQKPLAGNLIDSLSQGLVGFWLMNEGAGNIVFELSGNGGNGTISQFSWSSGKNGSCLYASGANDQVISLSASYKPLDGGLAFTVKILCKVATIDKDYGMFYTDSHSLNEPLLLWFDNAATDHIAALITCSGGSTGACYSSFVPVADVWYDIVLTWNNYRLRLYINGVEDTNGDFPVASVLGAINSTDTFYRIGNSASSLQDFEGSIDHVLLYNRALSASEIALLYQEPFCMFKDPFDLKLYGAVSAPPPSGGQVIMIQMSKIMLLLIPAFMLMRKNERR